MILALWAGTQLAKLGVTAALALATGARPEWSEWAHRRADIERRLRADDGKDVVVVRYGATHDFHDEWVRNAADIDASPVVWAHDLGAAKNAQLLDYFRDRKVWLLEVNDPDGGESLGPYGRQVEDWGSIGRRSSR